MTALVSRSATSALLLYADWAKDEEDEQGGVKDVNQRKDVDEEEDAVQEEDQDQD